MWTSLLNWLSVQQYYAEGGAFWPGIIVGAVDVAYWVSVFFVLFIIAGWILLPISITIRHRAKAKAFNKMSALMYDIMVKQATLLVEVKAELKKLNISNKRIADLTSIKEKFHGEDIPIE